jgi:F-type H+-transporting ATPase subunit delta
MLEFKTSYRYAKSLLDLSVKDNLLNTIYKDVILVNTICRNNKDLVLILKSPLIYHDKKIKDFKKNFL